MKYLIFLAIPSLSLAQTLCLEKIRNTVLTMEKINYPSSAQEEMGHIQFRNQNSNFEAKVIVYAYNGDTEYSFKGFKPIYAQEGDCVITDLKIDVINKSINSKQP